jgi:DNA repair exonuclease SbcCD ATPase subunit
MDSISKLIKKTKEKNQDYNYWKKELKNWENRKEENFEILETLEQTRSIFQLASQITQTQLAEKISSIVSSALEAVFPDPYKFRIDFVKRRNTTECDLLFEKNGKTRDPMESCGFGAADIASLALRIAYWKLNPNSRNTIILDEPTRALSKDKQIFASMLLKSLSTIGKGLQFLVVTHNKDLADSADRVFKIEQKNGISSIIQIEKEM